MMSEIFNSSFEISLRTLLLLSEYQGSYLSSDMITAIDFISVYGYDFGITSTNLHGDNIFKFSEFATRRELVQEALKTLVLKGLIEVSCGKDGFTYTITQSGINYCSTFKSDYANAYKDMVLNTREYINIKSELEILHIITQHSIQSLKKGRN